MEAPEVRRPPPGQGSVSPALVAPTLLRVSPASMGFVVMKSPMAVSNILALSQHTVAGWPISVQVFERQADKCGGGKPLRPSRSIRSSSVQIRDGLVSLRTSSPTNGHLQRALLPLLRSSLGLSRLIVAILSITTTTRPHSLLRSQSLEGSLMTSLTQQAIATNMPPQLRTSQYPLSPLYHNR